jgi:hypothetical protein
MEIRAGETYQTQYAAWYVEYVSSDSMIRFRRDDGRIAWFGAKQFSQWIIDAPKDTP